MTQQRNVAILIFDEVEVLDFCGPFEVFGVTGRTEPVPPFHVFTVAERSPVVARNGLSVNPQFTLENCPASDLLLIPGGWGTRREMHNTVLVDWVRQRAAAAELVLSVCTGALILGKAGLLDGLEATTHFGSIDLLRETAPKCRGTAERRFVDNGRLITSAGISAGIDMSLHVVARLLGNAGGGRDGAVYGVSLGTGAVKLTSSVADLSEVGALLVDAALASRSPRPPASAAEELVRQASLNCPPPGV